MLPRGQRGGFEVHCNKGLFLCLFSAQRVPWNTFLLIYGLRVSILHSSKDRSQIHLQYTVTSYVKLFISVLSVLLGFQQKLAAALGKNPDRTFSHWHAVFRSVFIKDRGVLGAAISEHCTHIQTLFTVRARELPKKRIISWKQHLVL